MANEEHFAILSQRVEVWDRWRADNPRVRPDPTGADVAGAFLTEANLRGRTSLEHISPRQSSPRQTLTARPLLKQSLRRRSSLGHMSLGRTSLEPGLDGPRLEQ
jgi:hypothetical protein